MPVEVEGVVTLVDPVSRLVFVQDDTAGSFVGPAQLDLSHLRQGLRVRLFGVTDPGNFQPSILAKKIEVIGPGEFPSPQNTSIASLLDGRWDCQWVSIRGVVRTILQEGRFVQLQLVENNVRMDTGVMHYPDASASKLLDAEVQLQGVAITTADGNRKVDFVSVYSPAPQFLKILTPPARSDEDIPLYTISQVLQIAHPPMPAHRLRVRGKPLPNSKGNTLTIQDNSGTLGIKVDPRNISFQNERVEVLGFLVLVNGEPIIEDASINPLIGEAESSSNSSLLPELNRLDQVRNLTAEKARLSFPVRVKGVVTFFDHIGPEIFTQDESSAIRVSAGRQLVQLIPGDIIEVEGFTSPGTVTPIIAAEKITMSGKGILPTPKVIPADRLNRGEGASSQVEISGIVRRVYGDTNHCFLDLVSEGIRFQASVPNFQNKALPYSLVDCRVVLHGISHHLVNAINKMTSFKILVPSLLDILVKEKALPLADIPVRAIAHLMRQIPGDQPNHRVRIEGTVLYHLPGKHLFVRDLTGVVMVLTQEWVGTVPGDVLNVVGFPTHNENTLILEDGFFEPLKKGPPPEPGTVSLEELFTGRFNGDLVRLQAYLLSTVGTPTGQTLIVRDRQHFFDATMENEKKPMPFIREGSLLEITGICLLKDNPPAPGNSASHH